MGDIDNPRLADEVSVDSLWKVVAYTLLAGMAMPLGAAFMGLDILLARSKTAASQMAAMLSDFIPESLALGAAFAHGGKGAMLLAILMALQNLPEGFNATAR